MEPPFPHPVGRLGDALARLSRSDDTGPDPLLELAAEHSAFIAFALSPDGILVRSVGPARQPIRDARGETIGKSVFQVYADLPAVTGAVARALRGVPVRERLAVEGLLLDCHFMPVRHADGRLLGVRGVAFPVETSADRLSDTTLSEREREVVRLLARGLTNADIGRGLFIAATTVSNYVRSARIKLEIGSRGELQTYAVERGWHLDEPDG